MSQKSSILVIFGGQSHENEVSVVTGVMVANVLKRGGEEVIPVYITTDGEWLSSNELLSLKNYKDQSYKKSLRCALFKGGLGIFSGDKLKRIEKISCVVNCCHGGIEEGGSIFALCRQYSLKCVSPQTMPSSVFINKYYTKVWARGLSIRTLPYSYITQPHEYTRAVRLGLPVVVKPVNLGSSIGISIARTIGELKQAVEYGLDMDNGVIVEKYLENKRDINCAVYAYNGAVVVSLLEEVISRNDYLSYDDKYRGGATSAIPAVLDKKIEGIIKSMSRRLYTLTECKGIIRFDFLVSDNEVYFSEANTVPGSLASHLVAGKPMELYRTLKLLIDGQEQQAHSIVQPTFEDILMGTQKFGGN